MLSLRYNLRSLIKRKTTALASVLGVALATLVLASAWMLAAGVTRTMGEGGREDTAIVIRKGSASELNSDLETSAIGPVENAPGVQQEGGRPLASAEIVVVMILPKVGSSGVSNVGLRGMDERSLAMRPDLKVVAGRAPQPGTDEAMIGSRLHGRFRGTEIGDVVELRKNRPLKVVGIFEEMGRASESEVFLDRAVLGAAFGRQGSVSSVHVRLTDPSQFDGFRAAVEQDPRLSLEVVREPEFLKRQSEGLSLFLSAMGTVIAVFFSVGAMLGATMTMHAAVANREREIGTLRALGFKRGAILTGFVMEAMMLTAVGGLLGVGLASSLSLVKISMINFATWSELVFTFTPTAEILVKAVSFAAVMGLMGGFFPAIRASRVSPLAAMRA
jgi:putative ABC transport system permease protein